jgi:hypothetical protein
MRPYVPGRDFIVDAAAAVASVFLSVVTMPDGDELGQTSGAAEMSRSSICVDARPPKDRELAPPEKPHSGAVLGDAREIVFHSRCVMPHLAQRNINRSPTVRDAHTSASIVLSSM